MHKEMHEMSINSSSIRNKSLFDALFFIFIVLLGLFAIISSIINMPYHKWLMANLPVWLAIVDVVIFGIFFIIMAIPTRSPLINKISAIVGLFSALILRASFTKAPLINGSIFILSVLLHILIRADYSIKKKRTS
jgi:hypothetical protein